VSVQLDLSTPVAVVTLDAPERRNALDGAMASAIADAIAEASANRDVGAIVITGAGKAFCAGAVRELLARAGDPGDRAARRELDAVYDVFLAVGSAAVPTIAAVNGAAVGAGLNLALATDVTVVATDAQLISGFARISIHPGGGHLHLLRRRAGTATAAAIGLLDQAVDGRRAVELGLAWGHCDADLVVDRARDLAAGVARDPDLARLTTRTLRRDGLDGWAGHVEAERGAQLTTLINRER
jgi:enoyl-CoA hydratase